MRILLSIVFVCLLQIVFAQNIDEAWLKENYTKTEQYIPMRDGVKLYTAIYSPNKPKGNNPILLNRTPYGCWPYGAGFSSRLFTTYWKEYIKENYIIVIQDVRGRWMSEGDFVDVRPFIPNKKNQEIDEASDTYDAVNWLVKSVKGNNKKVGVFGVSYPGFYATMAAVSGHPAIKAVSPQAPVTDWYMGDDFHHNGALMLQDAFGFYSGFGQPRPKPTTVGPRELIKYHTRDSYKFYLETGAISNFTKLMGDSIQFWNDIVAHPHYDSFWKLRDARRACYNIKPAILVVGGLFDAEDCFGAWRLYQAIEKQNPGINNKLVMGPWFHGGWGRSDGSYLGNVRFGSSTSKYYQEKFEIPFFQYHLKGIGSDQQIAEANIFFTGENSWKSLDAWPPKNAKNTDFFLNQHGGLSNQKQEVVTAFSSYISNPNKPVPYTEDVGTGRTREYMTDDQRFASRRPDVLTFTGNVLTKDVTVGGTILADLQVALSSTDADFIVKVIDVFPDGFVYDTAIVGQGNGGNYLMDSYQMLVRGEVMRGRYRNSFEKPEAFVPGEVSQVKFELPDIAHTFKKGHRIMIQIQSTWFPLVDRNPQQFVDTYHCTDSDFRECEIKVYHDSTRPSKIILPIME
ncbi:MAG: CocE/NonD family hydrolase [Bacteroidia bacterium]|nr:CocE/NonD family hydrolase [Bacteroidia bacterium]